MDLIPLFTDILVYGSILLFVVLVISFLLYKLAGSSKNKKVKKEQRTFVNTSISEKDGEPKRLIKQYNPFENPMESRVQLNESYVESKKPVVKRTDSEQAARTLPYSTSAYRKSSESRKYRGTDYYDTGSYARSKVYITNPTPKYQTINRRTNSGRKTNGEGERFTIVNERLKRIKEEKEGRYSYKSNRPIYETEFS